VERQPATAPFMLTSAAAVAANAPVGTAGAAAPASVAKTYRLDAAETMIAPHVGHKVEVTGTVEEPSAAAAAGAPAEGAGAGAAANAPRLKIESVKMVAATCN